MNDKRPSRRSIRRLLALGIAGLVTVSGLTALGLPASAHDGVDHGSEPGAESALDWTNYEKVLLTKNVGEPLDLAVLPTRRSCTRLGMARSATPIRRPAPRES
ncbi:hypothetical protein [Rathayibacter iranicus]|uniref:hypothetical protein n=1 Tax=Rathayibacter iranicus TaxID=59737 RepID=UPI001F4E8737|nr:hypothetical protein [Rathayibacter iranicus]